MRGVNDQLLLASEQVESESATGVWTGICLTGKWVIPNNVNKLCLKNVYIDIEAYKMIYPNSNNNSGQIILGDNVT